MKSAEIRRTFLDFFIERGHKEAASSSLIPSSYDPSILLTTAGMQPLKPFFLGQETPPASTLTSCQKCFRTPDIDEVGNTARHCTFFEMLGNFSFGDYFKAGAIAHAWQLVVDVFKLDPNLLWATVHQGDEAMEVKLDQEAIDLWVEQGLPRERIVPLGEDNFWKAGATGPCGPCSELYYDRGESWGCGESDCKPGCECDRYLEFYNLVFMQYDRDDAGKLSPLPKQNIDTGMGLERISAIMQGNVTVFQIDTMQAIVSWCEAEAKVSFTDDDVTKKALSILADHGRGMTFLASDGVIPSNEGRGYVLRRIIRRAIQQADRIGLYSRSGGKVLKDLSQVVVDTYKDVYPELLSQRSHVIELLEAEEERFLRTLERGSALLTDAIGIAEANGTKMFSGDEAFQLHDTYGFPVELTSELAGEAGLTVDRERFDELMRQQRERARAAAGGSSLPTEAAAAFVRTAVVTNFVGWDTTSSETKISAIQELDSEGDSFRVLLKVEASPLYAEGGGQVSDVGVIRGDNGRAEVLHVMRFEDDQVVIAEVVDGTLSAGDSVHVAVDESARDATQSNHTATHLLHRALRDRLGDHVKQAGSLVAPDKLRFDFSHTTALTADDIVAIEKQVNDEIAAADPVTWEVIDMETAKQRGAMMLFGEKYGDAVRMVTVGTDWSRELCGGTHVSNTGQIRLFIITSESSVGANARRIEALTGSGALEYLRSRAEIAATVAQVGHVEIEGVVEYVEALKRKTRDLEKELSSSKSGSAIDEAMEAAEKLSDFSLVVFRSDALSGDELLELSDRLKQKLDPAIVLVGGAQGDKVSLIANVSREANDRGVNANELIGSIAQIVGGGGGGRPTMARAGGKDASRLDEALAAGREAVHSSLG